MEHEYDFKSTLLIVKHRLRVGMYNGGEKQDRTKQTSSISLLNKARRLVVLFYITGDTMPFLLIVHRTFAVHLMLDRSDQQDRNRLLFVSCHPWFS